MPRDTATTDTCLHTLARRQVFRATIIGVAAPVVEYAYFIVDGLRRGAAWHEELGGLFLALAFMGAIAILAVLFVGWTLLYPAILAASRTVRTLIAPSVSESHWDQATAGALWILPYAAVLGAATWIIYSMGGFGGWPADVVFGTVAHVIAAWFYLSLLAAWFKLWKQSRVTA